jgi:hypothetical protein
MNPLDFQILTTLSIPNIHSFLKEVDRFRVKDSNQYRKSCVMEKSRVPYEPLANHKVPFHSTTQNVIHAAETYDA